MSQSDLIDQRIKIRHLRILVAVARWGSMAKAAKHLSISQSVLSKAIADLEGTIGVRLLDRSARGVEPTLYGQALVRRSVTIFNDLRTTISEIEALTDPNSGEVRIGCSEVVAAGMLGAAIELLSRQFPRLTFHVATCDLLTLQDRELRAHNIELMIGRLPSDDPATDLCHEILFQDHLDVVAGSSHPLIRRRKVSLARLANEKWCLPPPESYPGSLYASGFRARGLDYPHNCVRALSIQLQFDLLANFNYLTLLPRSLLQFSGKRLAIARLKVESTIHPWPVGIVTLKDRTVSPGAQAFIECVRQVSKLLTVAW